MQIYILRHGEAEPRKTGAPDAARKLTPKGKRELRHVLQLAKRLGVAPEAILTSPLARARETAEIASSILKGPAIVETRSLLPRSAPDLVWKEIGALRVACVLLAGHEPHLGRLLAFLLGAAVVVELKKGALAKIATKQKHGPPRGALRWMITPKIARALR